jgi:rhodanese-related sulfurtransferase
MVLAAGPIQSQTTSEEATTPEIERITVEELKAKIARNEPLAIIDVRTGDSYTRSDSKIKGAIFIRSRRLQSRLGMAPLKDLSRDIEVVTYCSCPDEETSGRAAQVLLRAGFKRVRALKGGWRAWLAAGGQVEFKPKGQE